VLTGEGVHAGHGEALVVELGDLHAWCGCADSVRGFTRATERRLWLSWVICMHGADVLIV
jgi:hypothetical protein